LAKHITPAVLSSHNPSPGTTHLPPEICDETLSRLTNFCRLLSEKWRLKLVIALTSGEELSAEELGQLVGLTSQAVSKSLKLMHLAGLVSYWRKGKYKFYRLESGYFHDLLTQLETALCRRS
jgi:predicted transcriptional regulator